MSKKKITKAKAPKATKTPKAASAFQVKKDGKGRFWVVPADGGAEQGPFDTKKQALDAKTGGPAPEAKAVKKAKAPKEKKVSAIDAAAQVLAGAKEPMNCKAMIEAMAKRALWTSPGGKTPHATLYSAIIREIALKGKEARFAKTERGKFVAKQAAQTPLRRTGRPEAGVFVVAWPTGPLSARRQRGANGRFGQSKDKGNRGVSAGRNRCGLDCRRA
jgi:hypothetical protein